jgi:hypothetical protein
VITAPAEPDGGRLPETIYSRHEKTRRHGQENAAEPDSNAEITIQNTESEGMNNANE